MPLPDLLCIECKSLVKGLLSDCWHAGIQYVTKEESICPECARKRGFMNDV